MTAFTSMPTSMRCSAQRSQNLSQLCSPALEISRSQVKGQKANVKGGGNGSGPGPVQRIKLYAAAAKVTTQSKSSPPRCRIFHSPTAAQIGRASLRLDG